MIAEPSEEFSKLRGPIYRYGAILVVVIYFPITISDDVKLGAISAKLSQSKEMIELALLFLLTCSLLPALLYFFRDQLRARLDIEMERSISKKLTPAEYRERHEFSPTDKKLITVLEVTEICIPWLDNVLPLAFGIWAFFQGAPLLHYLFTNLIANINYNQ